MNPILKKVNPFVPNLLHRASDQTINQTIAKRISSQYLNVLSQIAKHICLKLQNALVSNSKLNLPQCYPIPHVSTCTAPDLLGHPSLLRVDSMKRNESRVEVDQAACHVHARHRRHVERTIVTAKVTVKFNFQKRYKWERLFVKYWEGHHLPPESASLFMRQLV